jgi:hypothetical protein
MTARVCDAERDPILVGGPRTSRGRTRPGGVATHLVGDLGEQLGGERDDLSVSVALRLELPVDRLGQDPHGAILLDERFGLTAVRAVGLVLFCLHVLHAGFSRMTPQHSRPVACSPRATCRWLNSLKGRSHLAHSLRQRGCVIRVGCEAFCAAKIAGPGVKRAPGSGSDVRFELVTPPRRSRDRSSRSLVGASRSTRSPRPNRPSRRCDSIDRIDGRGSDERAMQRAHRLPLRWPNQQTIAGKRPRQFRWA